MDLGAVYHNDVGVPYLREPSPREALDLGAFRVAGSGLEKFERYPRSREGS
jgi:hypothetical protein